nr:14293_t:CDS:2 [Entrophospora candida]
MELELQQPSVVHIIEDNSESLDWNAVIQKVEVYRKQIKESKSALNPLYYYLIDHSGFHSPTSNLLSNTFPQMLCAPPKMRFCVSELTESETEFIDKLLKSEDVDDIPTNLSLTPVISCLEVSGGLTHFSRSKEWGDTLKLGLELWDLWVIAGDHLTGVDINKLVLWGLIVVDLYNLELAYLVLKEYKKKLDETKNMLIELSKKRNLEKPMGDKLIKKPKIISTSEKAQNKQTFFPYQK